MPFFRYYNGLDHFYTTNVNEIGTTTPGMTGKGAYKYEGVACSLLSTSGSNLAPLYRYWNLKEHFYTQNKDEIGTITLGVTGKYGYTYEGKAGYCYTSQVAGSLPFHRYYNRFEHFYTTNVDEIGTITVGAKGKHGYTYEGVACYVLP